MTQKEQLMCMECGQIGISELICKCYQKNLKELIKKERADERGNCCLDVNSSIVEFVEQIHNMKEYTMGNKTMMLKTIDLLQVKIDKIFKEQLKLKGDVNE